MSTEEPVYRRRKTSRCESTDRQQVIGGIGRRRNNANNAIQGRIQQFATTDENDEDLSTKTTNGDVHMIISPGPRRRCGQLNRSDSNVSANSTPTVPTPELSRKKLNKSDGKLDSNLQSKDTTTVVSNARNRRVSVATTTGKEHTQRMVRTERSESTSSLGQGSLLRSKNLKWENESSATEKVTEVVIEEKEEPSLNSIKESSVTPLSYRRKYSATIAAKKIVVEDSEKKPPVKIITPREKSPIRITTSIRDKSPVRVTSRDKSPVRITSKDKSPLKITSRNKSPVRITSRDNPVEKNPPPISPKKKSMRKTSTSIAAIQSQLETNFEMPKTTIQAVKKSVATRQHLSNITPSSSTENITVINKIKNRLYDVNNNDFDATNSDEKLKNSSSDITKVDKKSMMKKSMSFDVSSRTHVETTPNRDHRRFDTTTKTESKDERKLTKQNSDPEIQNARNITKTIPTNKGKVNVLLKKETDRVSQKVRNSSPGLTRRTLQSENNLRSGFVSSKTDHNIGKNLSSNNNDNNTADSCNTLNNRSIKSSNKADQNKNVLDTEIFDKGFSDSMSGYDNVNCTGVQNIANRFHAERNFSDQKDSSQQKSQGDISNSSGVVSYVNQETEITFGNRNTDENNYTSENNNKNTNVKKSSSKLENNYASYKKVSERLPARDFSTTSDSDENASELSREEQNKSGSDSSYSSNNNKTEEKDGGGKRRVFRRKRSKKNKTKPTKFKLRYEKNSAQSFDTSDGDILESNYTSDDRSRISSGVESTLCESDINSDNNDVLDVESKNKITYSKTVKENTEILTSQSTENNNNITDQKFHQSTIESIQELKEVSTGKNLYDGYAIKSSSMTTVSGTRQQNLTSFSSTNMGGSRSEDETSKLATLKKGKDDPNIGSLSSISKVSTKVLQSFNGKPLFSPLTKKRTLSADSQQYSTSYSELSQADNNNIKPNPFSLSNSANFRERYSDGEHEINTTRLEKLYNENDPNFRRSFTLPGSSRLKGSVKNKPFSFDEGGIPSQDNESAAELLNSLPSSPFSLITRFTRDSQIMQSKSTGSLGIRTSDSQQIERDIDIDNSSPTPKSAFSNDNSQQDGYIAPPDNFKDDEIGASSNNTSKRVKARPQLNISPKPLSIDENEIDSMLLDSRKPLRRSSYLQAHSDDMEDPMSKFQIPKVPPPPASEENQETGEVIKRPGKRGRPRLPATMITDSTDELEQDRDELVTPTSPTPKDRPDSDSDDDPTIDFINKVGKVSEKEKRSRPRPPLAQPPLLDGIPEERHAKKDNIHEQGRKRRPLRPAFAEETIAEEPRDLDCESPKIDERETDCNSQGSDLLSTPKDLSLEDLSSEVEKEEEEVSSIKEKIKTDINQTLPESVTPLSTTVRSTDLSLDQSWSESTSDLGTSIRSSIVSSTSTTTIEKSRTISVNSIDDNGGSESPISPRTIPTINTPDIPKSPEPAPKMKTPKPEMRRHVLQNLLDTERSYVQNLNVMLTMFFNPLKRPENIHIIEPSLVDEIFYQIPEILDNHEFFLEQLTNRVNTWSDLQIIGDIFITSFTKCLLMDAYSNFINNFVQAKASIRQASARPQFTKYVEQCTKEHREKLTLSDLLIMPVQRIPRYVLILKDMLKYTPPEHPDFGNLQLALDEIKTLADRMNKGEVEADQAERDIERLRDIEQTIEGITDLVTSSRKFIRQDLVAEIKGAITKKDRCLFLFSDLLVCTTVRRKNHALRRGSLGLFTGQSAAELNRYKFLWKLTIDDVDVSKANNTQSNTDSKDIEKLEEDVRILSTILTSTDSLSIPHNHLETHIKDIIYDVKTQIQEKQNQSPQTTLSPMMSKIELQAQVDDGTEFYTFIFLSAECKSSWEAYFEDAKQKLAYSRDTFPPEFQYPTPITKTRSGMQFTCAAPSYINGFGDANSRAITSGDVWVCNSDGYVGQVCLLTMIPEAQSKASLSVCSARIVCISVVPGARIVTGKNSGNDINKLSNINEGISNTKTMKSMKQSSFGQLKHKKSVPSDMSDDDEFDTGAANIMAFDSSGDEDSDMPPQYMGGGGTNAYGGRMSPDGSSLGAGESVEGERDSTDDDYSSDDDDRDRTDSTRGVPIGYPSKGGQINDFMNTDLDGQATMWLGTEDGHIYVYNAQDAITQRKSKVKLQLGSAVTSILYFENKVFIALGSGELCIYKRELGAGAWQLSSPETIHVSISGSAIACMTAVAGRIWCGCQNTIVLVNATSLKLETTITVSPDHNRSVHKIVSSGLGVWVSTQSSATVRLYHATTYENLLDVDVAPAVHKMLAGADAIIRQHKAACLRVTSLLICKDLLWIGTSAGVILTNPLPSITASTSVLRHSIGPTGSPHGHTGHVRFLTSVEVPKAEFKSSDYDLKDNSRISPSPINSRIKRKDVEKPKTVIDTTDNTGTVILVVSGGDGYEDFRYNQQTEAVGRDDSTNHLLIWRV